MPKVPIDYSKTCIYKLVHFDDLNDDNIYVGHSTNIVQRKKHHKNCCCNPNNKEYNSKKYQYIRENGSWEQWRMILVEKYPCNDVNEARARERYWIKELKAKINKAEPCRTRKEWREYNKQIIAEKDKKRYEANKEVIKQKQREKITCECGSIICKSDIARHRKTIKHQEWLKNNNLSTN
jgi:hypothetical protein